MIVDPGSYTNLMGMDLAMNLGRKAIRRGHMPEESRMNPMSISGVGNGSQTGEWTLSIPIAVPHGEQGRSHLHNLTIV